MDNRQSKPTGSAPSQGRVWYDLAWFTIVAAVTVWITWGAETTREFAGAVLGILLALLLGLQVFAALVQDHTARMKVKREALETALRAQGYHVQTDREVIDAWEKRRRLQKPGPY